MDSTQVGTHSAASMIGGLLTALGFKKYIEKRLDTVEKIIEDKLVFKDKCQQCEKGTDQQFAALMSAMEISNRRAERHEEKLDMILLNLSRRREDAKVVQDGNV